MDFSIIDKLFDIYKNEDIDEAKRNFIKYLNNKEKGYLINLIKKYIEQETAYVSNCFVSNKDISLEQNIVNDIIAAFENITPSVQYKINRIINDDYQNSKDFYTCREIIPQDLFNINIELIEKAVKEEADCFLEDFYKIKDLILYIKKNKVLKKLYKDDSWYELDFEELIYSLYDFIEDKSLFKSEDISYQQKFFLFEKIKENSNSNLKGRFEKFRPNLNSRKQMRANFGKLIFCRNLLMFYETGIMPTYDGMIDFSLDSYEHMKLIDRFKKVYSKNFDQVAFRGEQGNFICVPEVYSNNYKIEVGKSVVQDNKLIIGFIVSSSNNLEDTKHDYLIHIEIDDLNNSHSNYEMQISLIPNGKLKYRLQLMRLDNWEREQSHKNIAKKLRTTTHVHFYNQFDLLRGKTNGSFDIAYNIEEKGVDFESSLKTFLDILEFDYDVAINIYNTTIKCLESNRKKATEKEI